MKEESVAVQTKPNLRCFEESVWISLMYRVTMMKWMEVDFVSTGDLEEKTHVVMEYQECHKILYERA